MPELPEVEVVRRGLGRWLPGAAILDVDVRHPRPVRNQPGGATEFAGRLRGARITDAVRRGKFLWLPLDTGEALLAHLGMSGQLLLCGPEEPEQAHLRALLLLDADHGRHLRFVDQRMFGGLTVTPLVATDDGGSGGLGTAGPSSALIPPAARHIARDVLDPALDLRALAGRIGSRRTAVKRALLDQGLVSGIGNIYADEALWRARVHWSRPCSALSRPALLRLLEAVRAVMGEALAQGGTSFDSLYVDVNGSSGYFERSLAVYGRTGRPCPRCGATIVREVFANRSSFSCPSCQRPPRRAAASTGLRGRDRTQAR